MLWMTILKIVFVLLLCAPLAYLALVLYGQLMNQLNRTDRPEPKPLTKKQARELRRKQRKGNL